MTQFLATTLISMTLAASAPMLASAAETGFPFRSGEMTTPAALPKGTSFLSIAEDMDCSELTNCVGTVRGKRNRQVVLTHMSCLVEADGTATAFGAILDQSQDDETALAILPVLSRTAVGGGEFAVVGGPVQVVVREGELLVLFLRFAEAGDVEAVCTLTGTVEKL